MSSPLTDENAAALRRARFGTLPDRVAPEDLVATRPVRPEEATGAHDPDGLAVRFACLATDFGL